MATARRERAEAGGDRCAEEKDDAEENLAKRARRAAADATGEPGASSSYAPRGRLLAAVHPHARDARITFESTTHTYSLDGLALPASVTTVGSGCFESFDARAVLRRFLPGWTQNPEHKYYALLRFLTLIVGLTRAECEVSILKLWNAIGEEQSQLGTNLHAQIELSLNDAAWEGVRPRDVPATGPGPSPAPTQNPEHKYYALLRFLTLIVGLTRAECKLSILKLWNAIGEEQSQLGTDLHAQIELSLNDAAWEGVRPRDVPATGPGPSPAPSASKEWLQYQAFRTMINTDRNWSIYRTEWSIYDDDSLVGGQIDAVYVDDKDAMHIVDWKRSKKDLAQSAQHWNR